MLNTKSKHDSKIIYQIEYFILLVVILLLWFLGDRQGRINNLALPAPMTIIDTFVYLVKTGTLGQDLVISLGRVLKGYSLAILLGVSMGVALGISSHLKRISDLVIQIIKPIPPIAWIPLVILWFGIGEEGKVFLIFLGGFFNILTNTIDGVKQVDQKIIEMSKSLEIPFCKYIFTIVIPGAGPSIFTGLRTGLSSCWMCVVAAELIASSSGLGYLIMQARQFGQIDIVIVGMLTIGIIGKIMDSILSLCEKKVIYY